MGDLGGDLSVIERLGDKVPIRFFDDRDISLRDNICFGDNGICLGDINVCLRDNGIRLGDIDTSFEVDDSDPPGDLGGDLSVIE